MKPRIPRPSTIIKAALTAAASLTLAGCLTDSDYDLSGYNGPPFNYTEPPPVVVQKYVYECKKGPLGGEYCKPKPVGKPYSYGYFYPY